MNRIVIIGLISLTVLAPCVAQQSQTPVQAVEGLASRYSSRDTVFYASHAKFPFGTLVKVTNLENNKSVVVTIGGRIAADPRWIIDICAPAADVLGIDEHITGFTRVRVEAAPKAAVYKARRKFIQTGPASWQLAGTEFTAAHPSIPLTSLVRITNKATGKQEIATVTNRIPADGKRVIDLSLPLAHALGLGGGSAMVMIETVDKATGK
jgi:rare lipoprotein A (peptidoglycan hydrolase)